MANILSGRGTLLQQKISSTFTTLANRVEITGPKSTVEERDVTTLDSAMRQKRPAITDPGKVTLKLFFDPNDTNTAALRAKIYAPSQTLDEFKLVFPDGDTTPSNDDFKGFVSSWELNGMKVEDSIGADVEITISDQMTSTAGTP